MNSGQPFIIEWNYFCESEIKEWEDRLTYFNERSRWNGSTL
jgi:hypothetical protein